MSDIKFRVIGAGALLVFCAIASGQRLYNKPRDEAAQKAAEAGKALGNSTIFEKELKNLDTLAKLEADSLFSGAAVALRNTINTLATGSWSSVRSACEASMGSVSSDIELVKHKADVLRIEGSILQAKNRIQLRKVNSASSAAESAVKLLGYGADANAAAGELVKFLVSRDKSGTDSEAGNATALAGKIIVEATTAASTIEKNQKAVNEVQQQLLALESSLDDLEVRRLQVEADHSRDLASALQREKHDLVTIGDLREDCEALLEHLKDESSAKVVNTIRRLAGRDGSKADPVKLDFAIQALFDAAAIAARGKMPSELKTLRLAQAEQRYEIRKSQVEARAYEVAISSGTQRLSLFYKGGIRPESISQIVYTAATVAIPAVISTK